MRKDMFKIIVERPRLVNSNGYSRDGRKFRNSEDAPLMLGMKRGYRLSKWLNENLAPLQRFLERQINRPWNKVYSEIRAGIDGRSTVQQHILQHLDDFVAVKTRWINTPEGGHVVCDDGYGGPVALKDSRCGLYVHPRTGILLRNRRYRSWAERHRDEQIKRLEAAPPAPRDISDVVQLHCLDGIWYRVELAELPPPREVVVMNGSEMKKILTYETCWDVVRKLAVSRKNAMTGVRKGHPCGCCMYGAHGLYAKTKRQLSSRELKTYGIAEE